MGKHEWGVIAQIHKPGYREFYHCMLCNKFSEAGSDRLQKVSGFSSEDNAKRI
jgi:hypothetical protein